VPHGHPAAAPINALLRQGILCGYPTSSAFAGQRAVTRFEFATAAQRLTDQPFRLDFDRFRPGLRQRIDLPPLSPPFRDVPNAHWAAGAVDEVRQRGIVAGYADGTFRGDRPMSWNDLATATHRLHDFFVGHFGHEPGQGIEIPISKHSPNQTISRMNSRSS
jgi:hypothetical protein